MLKDHEPPVFTLHNQHGCGPLMIACDHAGNLLPEAVAGLDLSPELLELHIAYDIGARQVACLLSGMFDAAALIANYSRLLVDLNRYPGDPAQMPLMSDNHRITGNENLDNVHLEKRLDTFFHPYHRCHSELCDSLRQRFVKPLILSIHSFTPQMQDEKRPWHFGVLWDNDKDLAGQLVAGLQSRGTSESPPLQIGDNKPYSANNPKGYAITEHAARKNVEMALIEIRQDLLLDQSGQQWAARIIYDAVKPLLDYRHRGDSRAV